MKTMNDMYFINGFFITEEETEEDHYNNQQAWRNRDVIKEEEDYWEQGEWLDLDDDNDDLF